jgi:hypothetical protein
MSAIVQVTTISGKMIDNARWEVENITNLKEGHGFQVNWVTKDSNLLSYVGRINNTECSIDRNKNIYSVVLSCLVKQIRHMLDSKEKHIESMAILVPSNRIIENIFIYLASPDKCDPRVIQLIRSGSVNATR